MRIPVLCNKDDVITYSYDSSAGNTTAVDDGQEIAAVSNYVINNLLTKRIRFILYGSNGSAVVSESVQVAVCAYNAGAVDNIGDNISAANPAGGNWMLKEQFCNTTTDGSGLIDIQYTGLDVAGTSKYIIVYRPTVSPTESLVVIDTIK